MILRAGIHGGNSKARWSAACLTLRDPEAGDCELAAIGGADGAERETLAQDHGVRIQVDSFEELLATGIDFVVLTDTRPDRGEQVRLAAEQGVHCLLHAPMAATAADAEAMVKHCEEGGVHLGLLVPSQADPIYEQVRQMIVQGWFGGVTHVQCLAGDDDLLRRPPTQGDPRLDDELGANPILQLGSHHVHLAAWLTGHAPLSVTAQPSRGFLPLPADSAVATLVLRGNTTCTFAASHLLAAEQFAIHGTDGHVRVAGEHVSLCGRNEFAGSIFDYGDPGRELMLRRAELETALARERPACELHARFARSVDDRDDFPCPGIQAASDLRVLDAFGRALGSGRQEPVS